MLSLIEEETKREQEELDAALAKLGDEFRAQTAALTEAMRGDSEDE
jgi:hypothetical protein